MFNFFKKKSKEPVELFFHTDIHCHLVPGIDDGQQEPEGGAELVAREYSWGIRRIITTPHVTQDTFENTPEIINEAFEKLRAKVEANGTPVDLLHSAEYRIDGFLQSQLEEGKVNPMPNGYLLVENSFVQEAWHLDEFLFDLKIKGYRPILAHPERYTYYHGKRSRYKELHNAGTLFQINILSLAGHYGKEIKHMAEYLIENNMVDFLGSDMHNISHCEAIEAYIGSKDYRRHAALLSPRLRNDTAFLKQA